MGSLSGINANYPLVSIGMNGAVTPTSGLLASELSLAIPSEFGGASTFVELSGFGQLLSAAATFQDQLRSLRPGTATSGGGQNFGTDLASLAAETQSFVDAFNGLQKTIANINGTNNLLGGSITGASGLIQSLNALSQTNYANGNSSLTNLSQLGIALKPAIVPGESGSLSINLGTLQAAFNTDSAGAFSLLSKAANALGDLAGNFVGQAGSQLSSLAALAQTSSVVGLLGGNINNSILSNAQSNGGINLSNILLSESQTGAISPQQAILAMNEYALVSGLLG